MYTSVGGGLGCFHILGVVSTAAMIITAQRSIQVLVCKFVCVLHVVGEELLDQA